MPEGSFCFCVEAVIVSVEAPSSLTITASPRKQLVRQSQIVQSVIYGSDTVVTQVLIPTILSPHSQLGLFPFAEYEQTKT